MLQNTQNITFSIISWPTLIWLLQSVYVLVLIITTHLTYTTHKICLKSVVCTFGFGMICMTKKKAQTPNNVWGKKPKNVYCEVMRL